MVIGGNPFTTPYNVDVILNSGDGCFDAAGAPCDFATFGTTVGVPEPGTALLMGLGLVGLAARKETRSPVQH